jgi:hypothetical protein
VEVFFNHLLRHRQFEFFVCQQSFQQGVLLFRFPLLFGLAADVLRRETGSSFLIKFLFPRIEGSRV